MRVEELENKVCDLQMELRMSRSCCEELRAELLKFQNENGRLRNAMELAVAGHDDCCNYVCNLIKKSLAESV